MDLGGGGFAYSSPPTQPIRFKRYPLRESLLLHMRDCKANQWEARSPSFAISFFFSSGVCFGNNKACAANIQQQYRRVLKCPSFVFPPFFLLFFFFFFFYNFPLLFTNPNHLHLTQPNPTTLTTFHLNHFLVQKAFLFKSLNLFFLIFFFFIHITFTHLQFSQNVVHHRLSVFSLSNLLSLSNLSVKTYSLKSQILISKTTLVSISLKSQSLSNLLNLKYSQVSKMAPSHPPSQPNSANNQKNQYTEPKSSFDRHRP